MLIIQQDEFIENGITAFREQIAMIVSANEGKVIVHKYFIIDLINVKS